MLVLAFNRIVDPFWYYRDISIDGFNAIKPYFGTYERHVKPAIVAREQPNVLIFGSSFSEIGFDPLHPALLAIGRSYNFGMAGAGWDIVACNVQFAFLKDAALKQIVLGVHPEAMPQVDCRKKIKSMEHPEEHAFLFSYDALQASINTVLDQHTKQPSHTAEGLLFYNRGKPGTASRFREVFALHPPCHIEHTNVKEMSNKYMLQALDLSGLRDIIRSAKKKGIKVKLVIYPRHALMLEQDYQCGTRQARWDAEVKIVSLVEHEAGDMGQVWAFDGYHRIALEPISENIGRYWQDPAHFNYEFGNIMLDEMFAIKPPKFGIQLTSANLAVQADIERKARTAFLTSHPEFLQQLESLLPPTTIDTTR